MDDILVNFTMSYIIPGLVLANLRDLRDCSDILLDATSFFKILSTQQNSKFQHSLD